MLEAITRKCVKEPELNEVALTAVSVEEDKTAYFTELNAKREENLRIREEARKKAEREWLDKIRSREAPLRPVRSVFAR